MSLKNLNQSVLLILYMDVFRDEVNNETELIL